ncbi:MAG: PQQ-dependent sugar dehydrogenase [Patescibacteria group bacterium]
MKQKVYKNSSVIFYDATNMAKLFILALVITAFLSLFYLSSTKSIDQFNTVTNPTISKISVTQVRADLPDETIIAQHLMVPWSIAILPNNNIIFTERSGNVRLIDLATESRIITLVATLKNVRSSGEGGLLGLALHPNFNANNYIYLYYTYEESPEFNKNRVVRYTYKDKQLSDEKIIVDDIPGSSNHNGGRIKFGPDGMLYITTGDAENPPQAQDKDKLGGKILRVREDGGIPSDNPFGNAVYSLGHRNVQGIAWDSKGRLWATEHGRSGTLSGLDEINLIQKGGNYGWPELQGDAKKSGFIAPVIQSGLDTWAPAGMAIAQDRLFFTGLRGQALYELKLDKADVGSYSKNDLIVHYKNEYGRLRDVLYTDDNKLYILTSNYDGRGTPDYLDDRIILLNINKIK